MGRTMNIQVERANMAEHEWRLRRSNLLNTPIGDTQYSSCTGLQPRVQEGMLCGPHCNIVAAACFVTNIENLIWAYCILACFTSDLGGGCWWLMQRRGAEVPVKMYVPSVAVVAWKDF